MEFFKTIDHRGLERAGRKTDDRVQDQEFRNDRARPIDDGARAPALRHSEFLPAELIAFILHLLVDLFDLLDPGFELVDRPEVVFAGFIRGGRRRLFFGRGRRRFFFRRRFLFFGRALRFRPGPLIGGRRLRFSGRLQLSPPPTTIVISGSTELPFLSLWPRSMRCPSGPHSSPQLQSPTMAPSPSVSGVSFEANCRCQLVN